MHRLLLPVKIVIVRYGVGAERVGPDVWVESILHREPGTWGGTFRYLHSDVCLRESGGIVVDIHHLDLHAEKLERVLQKHLEVQVARYCLPAYLLPVYFLLNIKIPVLQVHIQVRVPRAGHSLEAAGGKFGDVQPQIFRDIPNDGPVFLLLRKREAQLAHGKRMILSAPLL
uniref:Uncharacterized protein n=1 Tax=Oncorhynchus tshawytscha TaxID=74940 RepID=A0AAZ3P1U2_ONCTS